MAHSFLSGLRFDFGKLYARSPESYFGPVEPSFFHALIAAEAADFQGTLALDLGCGDGRHARVLADAGWTVVGLDGANEGLEKARSQIGPAFIPIEYEVTPHNIDTIEQVALQRTAGKRFDLIVAVTFLDHLDTDVSLGVLDSAKRLLRPGGVLLTSVMNTWDPGLFEAPLNRMPGLDPVYETTSDTTSAVKHYYADGELLGAFEGWRVAYFARSLEVALHAPKHSHGFDTLCVVKPA